MERVELRWNALQKVLRRMNLAEKVVPKVCEALFEALGGSSFQGGPPCLSLHEQGDSTAVYK